MRDVRSAGCDELPQAAGLVPGKHNAARVFGWVERGE